MAKPMDMKNNKSTAFNEASDQNESEPMRYEKIANIMTSEVLTINPENTLHEASQLMGERHVGSLIVMKYNTPVGIITEGDLLSVVTKGIPLQRDWIRSSPSIRNEKVEKVMSYPLIKICVDHHRARAAYLKFPKV